MRGQAYRVLPQAERPRASAPASVTKAEPKSHSFATRRGCPPPLRACDGDDLPSAAACCPLSASVLSLELLLLEDFLYRVMRKFSGFTSLWHTPLRWQ